MLLSFPFANETSVLDEHLGDKRRSQIERQYEVYSNTLESHSTWSTWRCQRQFILSSSDRDFLRGHDHLSRRTRFRRLFRTGCSRLRSTRTPYRRRRCSG